VGRASSGTYWMSYIKLHINSLNNGCCNGRPFKRGEPDLSEGPPYLPLNRNAEDPILTDYLPIAGADGKILCQPLVEIR
jgi:hypothetical protein